MNHRPTLLLTLLLACTAPPPPPADAPPPAPPPPPVTVLVTATYTGASPVEVERSLTTPLEEAVAGTPDLTDLRSTTRSGRAELRLTFPASIDAPTARVAVQARLQTIAATLPDAVLPPIVGAAPDPHTAVLFTLQSARAAPDELGRTATEIRRELLMLSRVLDVEMCGLRTPQLEISLDPTRLTAYGLATSTVITALRTSFDADTALGGGLRLAPGVRSLEDVADLVITTREAPIRLRDLASIHSTVTLETCGAVRLGAGGAIVAVVHAVGGTPPDDFITAVRARLDARRPDLQARQIDLDVPPLALRIALDLEADMDPAATLTSHAGRLHDLLVAADVRALAFLQAPVLATFGEPFTADLFVIPPNPSEAAALTTSLATLPDLRTIGGPADAGADPQLHRVWISGPDRDTDVQIATYLADMLRGVPGITRARLRDQQKPEFILEIDRNRLATLGLALPDVRSTMALAADGLQVGAIQDRDTTVPVVVRLPADDTVRRTDRLRTITVQSANNGPPVALDAVITTKLSLEPLEILHFNRQRAILVEWFSADPNAPRAAQDKISRDLQLPAGVSVIWE